MTRLAVRSMSVRPALLGIAMVVTLLAFASPAAAKTCGGWVPCVCGDTVTGSATLTANLGICPGIGLTVKSGVLLDCAGHTITGSDLAGATYGILVKAIGATVKNCRVTKFRRAIRLYGGRSNQITDNETFANRYGIDVAGASQANTIARNNVHDNRDEGIHVGSGGHDNMIRNNTFKKNKNEAIYILRSDRCDVIDNTISAGDKAGVFVKHSREAYVAGNWIYGRVHVRGASSDNVFDNNHLRGNGYFFEAFEEPVGVWGYPHDNTVTGGLVENTHTCLRFAGAYDNTVKQLQLEQICDPPAMWPLGGQEPTGNEIDVIIVP
jgi:parallel beta-helix repeat protein